MSTLTRAIESTTYSADDERPIHAYTGEPIPPGRVRWIAASAEMIEDADYGDYLPMDERFDADGCVEYLVGHHDFTSRTGSCNRCDLVPLDWDEAETPCADKRNDAYTRDPSIREHTDALATVIAAGRLAY